MRVLKLLLLVPLFLISVVGGYLVVKQTTAPVSQAASGLTQVIAVKQGSLTSNITVVGELEAVQSADMTFSRMSSSAKLIRLDVKTGATVKAGQTLAAIDPAIYQQALEQAKSDLQAAEEKLADLKIPATKLDLAKADLTVAKGDQSVQQAQANLESVQSPDFDKPQYTAQDAQDSLALAKLQQTLSEHDSLAKSERDLQYAVSWHQRRIAELQVLIAEGRANLEQTSALAEEQQTLSEAQASLARIQASRELSLRAASASVAKAEATLEEAQDALATAQAGGDKLALAKAQVAVQEAQVALATAQDSRAELAQGTDATTLAAAQADVDKKRLAVAEAEADLAATTLVAPFDGTILRTRVSEGSLIAAATQILTVANMKTLQVVANVDETTIRRVSVGQTAQVTFDALPGQTVRGKVASVPLQGALQGNVMVYEVPITLTGAEDLTLLVGMTANVQIQTGQATNALLIPALAIKQVGNAYQVQVPSADPAGQPETVPVEIGLSDGVNTQITSGLNLGDKVVVQYQTSTSSSQQRGGGNIISQLLGRGGLDVRLGGR